MPPGDAYIIFKLRRLVWKIGSRKALPCEDGRYEIVDMDDCCGDKLFGGDSPDFGGPILSQRRLCSRGGRLYHRTRKQRQQRANPQHSQGPSDQSDRHRFSRPGGCCIYRHRNLCACDDRQRGGRRGGGVRAALGGLALLAGTAVAGRVAAPEDVTLLPIVFHAALVSSSLVLAYLGLGLLVSALANTMERAVVLALLVWLASVALHDFALIGLLLQWRMPAPLVFALAAVNPVEAARLAVLSSVDPELAVLGPVGFWIANTLGPRLAYSFGLAWPAAVGLISLWGAFRLLRARDAIR